MNRKPPRFHYLSMLALAWLAVGLWLGHGLAHHNSHDHGHHHDPQPGKASQCQICLAGAQFTLPEPPTTPSLPDYGIADILWPADDRPTGVGANRSHSARAPPVSLLLQA